MVVDPARGPDPLVDLDIEEHASRAAQGAGRLPLEPRKDDFADLLLEQKLGRGGERLASEARHERRDLLSLRAMELIRALICRWMHRLVAVGAHQRSILEPRKELVQSADGSVGSPYAARPIVIPSPSPWAQPSASVTVP